MSVPVLALAHCPLTPQAVAEYVGLPTAPHVPEDFDAVEAEVERRGWDFTEMVCESLLTGSGHVVCADGMSPFGRPGIRSFLVFGELYPPDPDDEPLDNGPWLYGLIDDWQALPGWSGQRPCTAQDCEAVLARAARTVAEHLGAEPERTVPSADEALGPSLPQYIWRTGTHALIVGPASDNGPYGYLTHLQLSCTPLDCAPELPPAGEEEALRGWIRAHIDW
ncbi:hypothetical protein ACFV6E_26520 [Streptomyces sp. NPDC059785]|uniref:hypothetical protein n=1 Tax=unclassified Streptomyces TaxID=2593676 RepID=UPI0036627BE0